MNAQTKVILVAVGAGFLGSKIAPMIGGILPDSIKSGANGPMLIGVASTALAAYALSFLVK